jgi:hypothetical protein
MTCRSQAQPCCRDTAVSLAAQTVPLSVQCSSTCGKGLQSRVVQCMHKITGRHGSECPTLSKPAAYRQCHQDVCNDKINVNTITSPRLGEFLPWPWPGGLLHPLASASLLEFCEP